MSCDRTVEVVAVHRGFLTVRPVTRDLCPACEHVGYCRSNWPRQKSPIRTFEIPMSDPISVCVGEMVTLSLDEHRLGQQVIKFYVPSLVGLVMPIMVGQSQEWNEMVQAVAAVFGFSLGWVVSRHWAGNFEIRVNR